jgi:N-acetylglutamate synthase-like GNAT family acetyltransferase
VTYKIRKAKLDDREEIQQLISDSARRLSREDYTDAQIEAALRMVYGVDTSLIQDGTYFVAETNRRLVGCGGWSRRKTLFGGDQFAERVAGELDPQTDPAKIRAFFIHPDFARQGIARAILARCESEARAHGFQALELMSTLPGIKLYEACGYEGVERFDYDAAGVVIPFLVMRKLVT